MLLVVRDEDVEGPGAACATLFERAVVADDASLRAAHRSGLLIVSPSKDLNRNRDAVIWVVTADHQDERQSPTSKSSDIDALMPAMSIDSAMVSRITSRPGSTLLGIRPGRATRSLIDSLRRWHHLG